jgi:hypothetical protein
MLWREVVVDTLWTPVNAKSMTTMMETESRPMISGEGNTACEMMALGKMSMVKGLEGGLPPFATRQPRPHVMPSPHPHLPSKPLQEIMQSCTEGFTLAQGLPVTAT